MRTIFLVALAAGIIAVTLIVIVVSTIPTKDYDLSVDALKDEQSLFTNARVVIKNTGKLPLTNIVVDYGNEKEPLIPVLQPGETMSLSPPEGTLLDTVTVTAEPDIMKVQEYRAPIKLPGMIGS
jgi:hypothetical protein